ncbi:MAG: hypothetical protein QW334_00235 [Thermofilum sp.]
MEKHDVAAEYAGLSAAFTGEEIIIGFNGRVAELSVEDWLNPSRVVETAERLGVSKDALFLKISDALDRSRRMVEKWLKTKR